LCGENNDLKRNLEIQSTNLEKLDKELCFIKENLGKRSKKQTSSITLVNLIIENFALRKILCQSDAMENLWIS